MNNILLMGGALDGRMEVVQRLTHTVTYYGQPIENSTELVEYTYHQMGTLGNFTVYQSSDYSLNFVDELVNSYATSRKVSREPLSIKPCENFAKVVAILAEHTQMRTSLIKGSTSFDDMHLDSLDKVEIVMSLEEEFEVEIPDRIAEGFQTVDDLVNAVHKEA